MPKINQSINIREWWQKINNNGMYSVLSICFGKDQVKTISEIQPTPKYFLAASLVMVLWTDLFVFRGHSYRWHIKRTATQPRPTLHEIPDYLERSDRSHTARSQPVAAPEPARVRPLRAKNLNNCRWAIGSHPTQETFIFSSSRQGLWLHQATGRLVMCCPPPNPMDRIPD